MNRYPIWVYITIVVALALGSLYTLPNFFGEAPAVQISGARATVKADVAVQSRVEGLLKKAEIAIEGSSFDGNSVRVRFGDPETQFKARDLIDRGLNSGNKEDPDYTVAANMVARSPAWLRTVHALPMYLGLDLRGGVHFLLQVDMREALKKRLDGMAGEIRTQFRSDSVRASFRREGSSLTLGFRDNELRDKARKILTDKFTDLALADVTAGTEIQIVATIKPEAETRLKESALKQNISTLNRRVNELGVAEPVIQQQGAERIVVQLPGVQDTAQAKKVIGRTATLELRMVDEDNSNANAIREAELGRPPVGSELYRERGGGPVLVKRQVELTGERLTDAQAGFDNQSNEPAVHLTLDDRGATIFKQLTRENVNKRMAILLCERGRCEVVTAPVIRSEIGGGRVQISGRMSSAEATETALLLRAGSLAASMEFVEERLIGPSLGADNIEKGWKSTLGGFLAIAAFMIVYYTLIGLFSVIALSSNLLFLVALLSMLQATLTLPGIAAVALTLGMAIDANVLINERIREELRNGLPPQAAIHTGYDRAFNTIIDSNVTTLIAGLALLIFGSGPVRGFAVVHCLGIMTSMFSAVVVSRALVNLYYGRMRKLEKIAIGNTSWS
ncbi:MAG: protein translocase subunit SecD [Betaproteobacteria bacterium]|nr:protein translocase subunit SecD [Betaproteobacteria bacterium]